MAKYEIYQMDFEDMHGLMFRGYDELMKEAGDIKKDWYKCVYELDCEEDLRLDDLFYIFNMQRPDDFHGHSLSVGDVAKTPDGYYYCDSFGWKKLDWENKKEQDSYKVEQLLLMLSHEEGDGDDVGYGAHLTHWFGDSKPIQLDAGALRALIKYYMGDAE